MPTQPKPAAPEAAHPGPPAKPADKTHSAAVPPRWEEPKEPKAPPPPWTPEPALDPRTQKPPEGVYADGMTIADEQRARSAWIEAHGMKAYEEAVEDRPADERGPKQVPAVTPPTKRE